MNLFSNSVRETHTRDSILNALPINVAAVMVEAENKTKELFPTTKFAWQDQMIIGLTALLAEQRKQKT